MIRETMIGPTINIESRKAEKAEIRPYNTENLGELDPPPAVGAINYDPFIGLNRNEGSFCSLGRLIGNRCE